MRNTLKFEEAGMLLLSCFAWYQLNLPWWIFFTFFLAPDIGMLGYLINVKAGAASYNLFHHKGIAAALWVAGMMAGIISIQAAGIILFAHSSFDRILGMDSNTPTIFSIHTLE